MTLNFSEVKELLEDKCKWTYDSGHNSWNTSCGQSYDADDFACRTIYTCPTCSRETTV